MRAHAVLTVLVLPVALLAVAACGSSSGSSAGGPTSRVTLLPGTTTTQPPATIAAPIETTTTSTTTTTTTTTTLPPVANTQPSPATVALQLSGEGIGAASFSSEPEGVIAYLASFLGEPTDDTGWVDPFLIGSCSGTELRLVSFGVLTLTFGDFSRVLEGRRHFFAYTYGDEAQPGGDPLGLETKQGITVGSRLVDLLSAYPSVVLNPSDDFTPNNFVVNDNLRGFLTGLADDSEVTVIFGGQGCGE